MGWKEFIGGKADGIAYQPTRSGMEPMMRNGRPVKLSELTKEQRAGTFQSTKPAPRRERKQRKEWGR